MARAPARASPHGAGGAEAFPAAGRAGSACRRALLQGRDATRGRKTGALLLGRRGYTISRTKQRARAQDGERKLEGRGPRAERCRRRLLLRELRAALGGYPPAAPQARAAAKACATGSCGNSERRAGPAWGGRRRGAEEHAGTASLRSGGGPRAAGCGGAHGLGAGPGKTLCCLPPAPPLPARAALCRQARPAALP